MGGTQDICRVEGPRPCSPLVNLQSIKRPLSLERNALEDMFYSQGKAFPHALKMPLLKIEIPFLDNLCEVNML